MCKHGTTVLMPIQGRACDIDSCIHDIVAALNAGGRITKACCCGHGRIVSSILLADGRVVEIYKNRKIWQAHRKKHSVVLPGKGK